MAAESKTLGALFPEMDIEALSAILAVTGGDVVAAERMILEGSPVATSESNADAAFAQTLADEELARQLQQQWVAETRVAEAGEERGEGTRFFSLEYH